MKFPFIEFDLLVRLLGAQSNSQFNSDYQFLSVLAIGIFFVFIIHNINVLMDYPYCKENIVCLILLILGIALIVTTGIGGLFIVIWVFFLSHLIKFILIKTGNGIIYLLQKKSVNLKDHTIANIICWTIATALILFLFYILFQQTILSLVPVLPLEKP